MFCLCADGSFDNPCSAVAPKVLGRYIPFVMFSNCKGIFHRLFILRLFLCTFLVAILATCQGKSRTVLAPTPVPETSGGEARGRFLRAQALFESDTRVQSKEFARIVREFPSDPIVPLAQFFAGLSDYRGRNFAGAATYFRSVLAAEAVEPDLQVRSELYLGYCLYELKEYTQSVLHLQRGEASLQDKADRRRWLEAMANAISFSSEPLRSLSYYDEWYPDAQEKKQVSARSRIRELVADSSAESVESTYRSLQTGKDDKPTISMVILGERFAEDLEKDGRIDMAKQLRADLKRWSSIFPFSVSEPGQYADPELLAALVPLTGSRSKVGELVMRGLAIATGSFSYFDTNEGNSKGQAEMTGKFRLSVRDSQSVQQPVLEHLNHFAEIGAIAAVGPVASGPVDIATKRAEELGLPLITLNARAHMRKGLSGFHIVHSAESRAQALAAYAVSRDIVRFAVLRPNDGYGAAVGTAFREKLLELGGEVVAEETYEKDATFFTKQVARLAKNKSWQAILVPDQAKRLELIAPALMAKDLRSAKIGFRSRARRRTRNIVVLSTAEFLDASFIKRVGKYCEGAILAPGFYADKKDTQIGPFVAAYDKAFGSTPTTLDAYAYDAAAMLHFAVKNGISTREGMSQWLSDTTFLGVTGTVTFDLQRRRADRGKLFVVERENQRKYIIRSLPN